MGGFILKINLVFSKNGGTFVLLLTAKKNNMSKLIEVLRAAEERGDLPKGTTEFYKKTLEKFPENNFVKPFNTDTSRDYSVFSHLDQLGLVAMLRLPRKLGTETYFIYRHDLDFKKYLL